MTGFAQGDKCFVRSYLSFEHVPVACALIGPAHRQQVCVGSESFR